MCTKEAHTVDFQIKTNIDVNPHNKKFILLLILSIVSVICSTISIIIICILNSKIIDIQIHVSILNNTIISLSEKCNSHHLTDYPTNSYLKSNSSEKSFEEMTTKTYEYDDYLEVDDIEEVNSRIHRAAVNQNKRRARNANLLAVHFKGSLPEIQLNDKALIGPWWYDDNTGSGEYKFSKFHLTEERKSIEITEPALYFIYAQIYYHTTSPKNSYSICVRSEGSSVEHVIARCSAVGTNNSQITEISCFTAGVKILKKNDRVYLKQIEKNRLINLRDGYSFFGLVRLNNSKGSGKYQN